MVNFYMLDLRQTLSSSLQKILSALIRTLLRNGFSYGDFDQIARKCFVDIAYQDFTRNGKKQTVSNISILTGLNRKEVKKLHEQDETFENTRIQKRNRCVRVLGGWLNDKDFTNAQGMPADLPVEGKASFSALVKKFSGDMPVVAMQNALLNSGNISTLADSKIRLLNNAYMPSYDPLEKLSILGTDASELIETINHNLIASQQNLHFQRKASNDKISSDSLPEIQQFIKRKSQAFLEEVDLFLSHHETHEDQSKQCKLSIGVYHYQNQVDKES